MRFCEDSWLAGFTDGEGSFGIYPAYRSKGGYVPRFVIKLRADDVGVLEELSAEFGGKVRVYGGECYPFPFASWIVSSKADLQRLSAYFDRFPLRAKKARDYAIWRRAVIAYAASGTYADELPSLHAALVATRAYDADPDAVVPDTIPSQLEL